MKMPSAPPPGSASAVVVKVGTAATGEFVLGGSAALGGVAWSCAALPQAMNMIASAARKTSALSMRRTVIDGVTIAPDVGHESLISSGSDDRSCAERRARADLRRHLRKRESGHATR